MVGLSILLHSKLDKGWFGCLSCQHIGRPIYMLGGQFASIKDDLLVRKTICW